jgi:hypothetical protein
MTSRLAFAAMRIGALLITISLLATACSTGGSEVPEGFVELARDGFAVAHPDAWRLTADEPGRYGVTGVQEVGGVPESMIVRTDPTWSGDFDAVVRALIDPFRLVEVDDWQQTADEDIEVEGATWARLIEGSYASPEAERIRTTFIIAIADEDSPLVLVDISAPDAVFDADVAEQIRRSIRV